MQKTITLKDFKVFLLKTVLAIFVLGISFQVSFAQSIAERKAAGRANLAKQVVVAPPTDAALSKSGVTGTTRVIATATDVPSLNQKVAELHSLYPSITTNPNPVTTSPNPIPHGVQDVCTFNGGLTASSLNLPARMFRDAVPGVCPTKACNGPLGTGPYYYATYTMQNLTCAVQCVNVNYIANAGGGDCFVAVYNGSFNPANICTNFMSDGGSSSLSGGAAVAFNVSVAVNQTIVLVVNGAQPATACPSYTITVTGLTCTPPPPCQPPTSSILSQAGGPPVPTNLFNETFNTVVPLPAGWASQNLSSPVGATGWFQGNAGVFAGNTPPGYIAANFNNTTGTNTISNWLFCPNVNLKNGDKFSFWTRTTTGTFPDRLQVRMSTNGASVNAGATNVSVGDFSTLLLDINPTYTGTGYPTAWTQFTLTMSGLPAAGVSGRLAFRYFVEGGGPGGNNSDYIGIDDAKYTTFSPGPVVTCTGSTAGLQVNINGGTPGALYNVVINRNPPGGVAGNFTVSNYASGNYIPVTPAVTTTYSLVSVIQADNPCCVGTGNSGTPTITVLPATIQAIAITASPDAPLCSGDPTQLDVVAGIPLTNWLLTQSTSHAVVTGNSVACNAGGLTTDNSYWRVYPLTPYGMVGPFTITNVQFGVELANLGPQTGTIRLYTQTGAAFPGGTRTLISTTVYNLPNQTNTIFTVPVTPVVVNPTDVIVVECFSPGQNKQFFFGSNPAAQTGTTYLSAAPCGITTPTDIAAIGFPGMHIILDIGGTTGGASGPLPPNWTVFWSPAAGLSSTSTHPVAASPMVTTQYTVLATDPGTNCQTSASKTIVVRTLPYILAQPVATTVCAGSTATFTANGAAAGATFQWQVSTTGAGGPYVNVPNAPPYSGVTTTTLTINPTTGIMNGNYYRMVVSGTCPPPANTVGAQLTINALPIVTLTPAGPICGGVPGQYGVLITAGSAPVPVPGSITVTNATPVPVPDNTANGVTSAITIPALPPLATIVNVRVVLNMSHTYPGDMIYNLKAPNGNILNLYKYAGGSFTGAASGPPTWGWYGASCNMTGTVAWNSITAPYIYNNATNWKADALNTPVAGAVIQNPVGYVSAATSFNDLISVPNGVWTLAMCDGGAGDVGTLSAWSLSIDYTTPGASGSPLTYTWSPAAGLYLNASATVPYPAGTQISQVYAAPVANTVYTVTASDGTTGCQNTGTILVNYTPPAPAVTPSSVTMCLGDSAVKLQITSSLAPSPFTTTYTYSGPPVPIVDNTLSGAVTPLIVPLPSTANITSMFVTLNMTHTWDGDCVFALKAPNGKVLNLDYFLSGTGGAGPTTGFTNTMISSTGTTALNTGANPYNGTFKADLKTAPGAPYNEPVMPTSMTGTITGLWSDLYSTPNGTWSLGSYDGAGGDFGTITSWALTFNYLYGPPAAGIWTPNGTGNGLYNDMAATSIYTGLPANIVYTRPAASTVYSVTVATPVTPAIFTNATSGFTPGNGNYTISFNVKNNNAFPMKLTGISSQTFAAGTANVTALYKTSAINGPPGAYTVANGWNSLGTATIAGTTTLQSFLSGLSLIIPAGATYGFCVQAADGAGGFDLAYSTIAAGTYTFTQGNVSLITGTNIGYGGVAIPAAPGFTPRGFQGSITYELQDPSLFSCTSGPTLVPVTVNVPVALNPALPVDAVVCTDKVASFSVGLLAGTTPTYQWQVSSDAGNTWTNVVNGAVYSGATSATLTLTKPPVAWNSYLYRCIVGGAAPCGSATSRIARLTVNPLPVISLTVSPFTKLWPGLRTNISSTTAPAAGVGGYTWLRAPLGGGAFTPLTNPAFGVVSGVGTANLLVDIDGLGIYALKVTDVNGCVNTSAPVTIADSLSGRVFIYPNPTGGIFQVRYNPTANNVQPRGLNVINKLGQRIIHQDYGLGLPYARMTVNMSNFSSGIYYVEVVDVNGGRLAVGRVEILR